jgi:hypothetical protein
MSGTGEQQECANSGHEQTFVFHADIVSLLLRWSDSLDGYTTITGFDGMRGLL